MTKTDIYLGELRLAEAPRTNKLKLVKPSLKLDTEKVSGIYLVIHREENPKKKEKERNCFEEYFMIQHQVI